MERVLFVCIGNAGRSQMAQAFYEDIGGEARSAGTRPETELHPEVVETMREVGIDIRGRVPNGLSPEDVEWAESIVKVGCGDECPNYPGKRMEDWEIADPIGLPVERVRPIRDEIRRRVNELGGR